MSITAALAAPDRPPADRERDLTSKPAEVLAFLGVAPGMTVLDMNAASGWYTEILARVVGASGHVIAHNHPGARATLAGRRLRRGVTAAIGSPNVEQIFVRHNDLELPPESLDLVLHVDGLPRHVLARHARRLGPDRPARTAHVIVRAR